MHYLEVDPGPRLRPFVECLWALESADGAPVERVVPDGKAEVVLHLGASMRRVGGGREEEQQRALVVGQQQGPVQLRATGAVSIVAARLRPHALAAVLGAPGRALAGRIEPLDAVVGRDANRWLERSAEARSPSERLVALRAALEARVVAPDGDDPIAAAASRLVETGGRIGIDALATRIGLGRRQLERRFSEQVGLTPKRYGRIVRFARAVAALEHEPPASLAALAVACGYADQPHLNRDFREFAGCSPTAYVAERNAWNAVFGGAVC